MRVKTPVVGDKRIKTQFLWSPKMLNGESRWMETVRIEQVFGVNRKSKKKSEEWLDVNWVDVDMPTDFDGRIL